MRPIDLITQKLSDYGLRSAGRGKWVCRCPAHEDRSPSLSITEGDDGRVLMHCFAGCEIDTICNRLMIDIVDLFPPREERPNYTARQGKSNRITYLQALQLIKQETYIVWMAAQNLAAGHQLKPEDLERLDQVTQKITSAMEAAGV